MSKKFGLTIAFMSAFAFFCGWYSFTWIVVGTILVLLLTDEEVLKKNVLNAFFLSFVFLLANLVFNWISLRYTGMLSKAAMSNVDWIYNMFNRGIFKSDITLLGIVRKLDLAGYIVTILRIAKFVLMIIFAIMALKGKEVKVPVINNMALKAVGIIPEKKEKKEKKEEAKAEGEAKEENPLTSDKATLTDIPNSEK